MAMEIVWDVAEGASVSDGINAAEIVRPILVRNMPQDCSGGASPAALLQALGAPGMPLKGSFHPTATAAVLEDRRVRAIGAVDAVRVELVYRQKLGDDGGSGATSTWTLTDATQTSHDLVYGTADGSDNLRVFYKAGAIIMGGAAPANARQAVPGAHKFIVNRIIKATGILRGTDWASYKASVYAAKGKINSDTWGGYDRGTWFFVGPTTKTFDRLQTIFTVELTFVEMENGHFPILAFFDEKGVHPADCDAEAALRAMPPSGPPAVNTVKRGNGLAIASIYKETAFSSLFAFTPG